MKIISKVYNSGHGNRFLCELSEDEFNLMLFGVSSLYSLDEDEKKQAEEFHKKLSSGHGNLELPVFSNISRVMALARRKSEVERMISTLGRASDELKDLIEYQEGLDYFLKWGDEPLDV